MSMTVSQAKAEIPGKTGTLWHQRLPGEGADGLDGG